MFTKNLQIFIITCALTVLNPVQSHAGKIYTKTINTNGASGVLKVLSGSGDVSITGYAGKEVIIEAETDGKTLKPPEENEKAKGLKRIAGSGFNVTYDNDDNTIIITRPAEGNTNLGLKVPHNMELKIGGEVFNAFIGTPSSVQIVQKRRQTVGMDFRGVFQYPGSVFEGNVTISKMDGNIEVNIINGDIIIKEATGVVIANAVDGDIEVTFAGTPHNKPMAFSTVEGDVDVTLPKSITATIRANNVDGEVYTDFEMDVIPGDISQTDTDKMVMFSMFSNTVTGKINGGGAEVQMTSVNGSIYIRKGK